jgi:formamidopyrimidine-DNA glycosylase
MLRTRSTKLKPLLLDQRFLAGLGNIYTDEILWAAGLRPDRPADTLSSQEIRRLYRALVETLHEAVKHRGSTLPDQQYVDLAGKPGDFQLHHNVYNREGQPCRRCRHPVERVKMAGRSTFYCPACQV